MSAGQGWLIQDLPEETPPGDVHRCRRHHVLIEIPYGLPPALFTLSDRMAPGESADPHRCLDGRQQAIGCRQADTSERLGSADEPRGVPSCTGFAHALIGFPATRRPSPPPG